MGRLGKPAAFPERLGHFREPFLAVVAMAQIFLAGWEGRKLPNTRAKEHEIHPKAQPRSLTCD
jgi:hypothetical protein